jgi:hypothetical protein
MDRSPVTHRLGQWQRRRRLREREQRLQRDGDCATDGPTSLQTPLCTPANLTARRSAQRARRLRERDSNQ